MGAFDVEVSNGLDHVAAFASGMHIIDFGPEYERGITVEIDIRPGSAVNRINPLGLGVIPVAILGSAQFDVHDIDRGSLAFGPAGALPRRAPRQMVRDVDRDGFDDLLSYYRTSDTGIAVGDEEACVTGETTSGVPLAGCDTIMARGCGEGFALALLIVLVFWPLRRQSGEGRGWKLRPRAIR
jgi:hypothetical protein